MSRLSAHCKKVDLKAWADQFRHSISVAVLSLCHLCPSWLRTEVEQGDLHVRFRNCRFGDAAARGVVSVTG